MSAQRPASRPDLGQRQADRQAKATDPVVEVLLSTFQGATFLPEQLRSIEGQTLVPRRILVRDDGSTDATPDLLEALGRDGRYRLLPQQHLGSTPSYFELLRATAANADYVAFADQDDVWKPGKLQRAVTMLRAAADEATPALYCSRVEIVDEQLRPLGLTPLAPYHPSLANALVQNIAMGCTIVMNRAARDLIASVEQPKYVYHDWWSYLTIAAFGLVLFDPEPSLLYRQHGGNLVGADASPITRLVSRIRRQLGRRPLSLIRQAEDFLRLHGDALAQPDAVMVRSFIQQHHAPRLQRLRSAAQMPLYRQSKLDTLAMRALYVLRDDF